jgi:hypothetical protein
MLLPGYGLVSFECVKKLACRRFAPEFSHSSGLLPEILYFACKSKKENQSFPNLGL